MSRDISEYMTPAQHRARDESSGGTYFYTLPWPPSANVYYRNVNGKTLLSRDGRSYKSLAQQLAVMERHPVLIGPVAVHIVVYRPRKAGDVDNRIKPLLDSLNGIAFEDDKQVVELHVYRQEDKTNPRAEVMVRQVRSGAAIEWIQEVLK